MRLEVHVSNINSRKCDQEAGREEDGREDDDYTQSAERIDDTFSYEHQILRHGSVDRSDVLRKASDDAPNRSFIQPAKGTVEDGVHELQVNAASGSDDAKGENDICGRVNEAVYDKDGSKDSQIAERA